MKELKKLAVILAGICVLAGCSSTVKLDDDGTGTGKATAYAIDGDGANGADAYGNDPIKDPNSPVYQKRSVYFDFDKYTIREADRPVVSANANYLNTHKARKVVIQGNTDERGGREYNLALGQKRAEAVRRSMKLQGVTENQMEAVSFGKEKPKAEGHNEAAWSQNRRADIVYQ